MTEETRKQRLERPLSPYMIGSYYKPQLSSMLSIAHRASGVFLSIFGATLMVYWLVALSQGPVAYHEALMLLSAWPAKVLLGLLCFAIYYHSLNGIRHLIWDTGRMLEIKQANLAAIIVLIASSTAAIVTVLIVGGWL